VDKSGHQVITFYINANAIPDGKTSTDVANDIQSSATANGNQGIAYVLSGTSSSSSTSFGNVVLVSLVGMFFALLI